MKRTLWLACLALTVASGALFAQARSTAAPAQAPTSTDMAILKQKLTADKKLLVAANMQLTEAEAKAFWPIYDTYQKDLEAINARTKALITTYADAYNKGPVTNDTATKLLTEMLAIEEAEVKLKQSYVPKLEGAVPAMKVARYIQLETKIRAIIKYELAATIPVIE